jgi:hypothetical protein
MFGWLFTIYCAHVTGYKWRTWLVRPAPPAHHAAALLLLSLAHLTSIIDVYVLCALHRVRAQLPLWHLQRPLLKRPRNGRFVVGSALIATSRKHAGSCAPQARFLVRALLHHQQWPKVNPASFPPLLAEATEGRTTRPSSFSLFALRVSPKGAGVRGVGVRAQSTKPPPPHPHAPFLLSNDRRGVVIGAVGGQGLSLFLPIMFLFLPFPALFIL